MPLNAWKVMLLVWPFVMQTHMIWCHYWFVLYTWQLLPVLDPHASDVSFSFVGSKEWGRVQNSGWTVFSIVFGPKGIRCVVHYDTQKENSWARSERGQQDLAMRENPTANIYLGSEYKKESCLQWEQRVRSQQVLPVPFVSTVMAVFGASKSWVARISEHLSCIAGGRAQFCCLLWRHIMCKVVTSLMDTVKHGRELHEMKFWFWRI